MALNHLNAIFRVLNSGFRFPARLRPALFQMPQDRIFSKTIFVRTARENFDFDLAVRQIFDALVALLKRLADDVPNREPGIFLIIHAGFVEAKGKSGVFAERQNGGEQIQFLRRHFGEAVEP